MRTALSTATLLLAAFLATPAAALCGDGAASEDLTNECLVSAFEGPLTEADRNAIGPVVADRLSRAGLDSAVGLPRAKKQPDLQVSVRPLLEYSTNLNGGQTVQTVFLFGLPFSIGEDRERKEGLAIGAELGLSQRLLLGNGHRLDLFAAAAASHAPKENFNIFRAQVGGCHTWRINQPYMLTSCLSGLHVERELSRDDVVLQSVSATRFLAIGATPTALEIGVERRLEDRLDQKTLTFGAESILSGDIVGKVSLGVGRFGEEEFGISQSLDLSVTAPVTLLGRERAGALRYSQARQDGAEAFNQVFFQTTRIDRFRSLSVQMSVTPRIAVELGYVDRNSTIDDFDESYPTVGLKLAPYRF